VFHPGKITENLPLPNGVISDDQGKLQAASDVSICSKIASSRIFPDRRNKWDLAVIY
jgi:hypothetical protein